VQFSPDKLHTAAVLPVIAAKLATKRKGLLPLPLLLRPLLILLSHCCFCCQVH
jgi:hypothetical protein